MNACLDQSLPCLVEEFGRLFPLFDEAKRQLLVLSAKEQCCSAAENVEVVLLQLRRELGGEPHRLAGWTVASRDSDGATLLTTSALRRSALAIRDELRRGHYIPLNVPAFPSPSGYDGYDLRWARVDEHFELVMRAHRVTMLRDQELVLSEYLPSFPAHPFCCGIEPDSTGKWPASTLCQLPARVAGVEVIPDKSGLLLTLVSEGGPDGCEHGPRYHVVPLSYSAQESKQRGIP
jgi:hypothetical protein